jgi:uncharacterized protein (TIGR03382 family)
MFHLQLSALAASLFALAPFGSSAVGEFASGALLALPMLLAVGLLRRRRAAAKARPGGTEGSARG